MCRVGDVAGHVTWLGGVNTADTPRSVDVVRHEAGELKVDDMIHLDGLTSSKMIS